ncbi:hypothetical protein F5Y18DRAFT_435456 [Xylariaceae sp. FL1019]|nr:hypothetical protein F5Y18DRAFT_435456 [Xylariaceae sp. FL1019]
MYYDQERLTFDESLANNAQQHTDSKQHGNETDINNISIPILPDSLSGGILAPIFAIVLQTIIIAVLAVSIGFDFYFFVDNGAGLGNGEIPSAYSASYVTGITIIATAASIFTTGQIRRLWINNRGEHLGAFASIADRRHFSVLTGTASLKSQLIRWDITASLAVVSLLTTSIVAGLSPKSVLADYSISADLYPVRNMTYDRCYTPNSDNVTSIASQWFNWTTSSGNFVIQGSSYVMDSGFSEDGSFLDRCETKWILPTLMNYQSTPGDYAYSLGGTAVHSSALGVPFNSNSYTFGDIFAGNRGVGGNANAHMLGVDDQFSTMCMPVLAYNPVTCTLREDSAAFNILVDENSLTISNSEGCIITSPTLQVDPSRYPGATVAGACTQGHELGTATILIGSTRNHAELLSWVMGQEDTYPDLAAVQCSIDVRSVVEFRQVNITRPGHEVTVLDIDDGLGKVTFLVRGDDSTTCIPRDENGNPIDISVFLPDTALATAAAASWELLAENRFDDGFLDTIIRATDQRSHYVPKKEGTVTKLEGVLGTATGVALGMYWGRYEVNWDVSSHEGVTLSGGIRRVKRVRVGPGELWAIVYVIPPLFSAGLLLYLLRPQFIGTKQMSH